MTIELKMLSLSILLGLAQIIVASHAASMQRGYRWTAGPRDEALSHFPESQVVWNAQLEIFLKHFRSLRAQ